MKRPLFIIIGVIIVLILVAVWVYLLFFSTPSTDNDSRFSDFLFGDTTDTSIPPDSLTNGVADEVVDINNQERLRQLTTSPVLTYREVPTSTSTPQEIRYVEAGTGHIYSINYQTGETTRLSATTIPVASKAAMSPNGQFVMVRSGEGRGAEFIVGSIATSGEKIITTAITENVVDFVIPNNNEILYGVQLQGSYVGKRYSLATGEQTTIFTIPFREVAVSWGERSDDTHYAYPKATNQLEGFVYKINNGSLQRLPIDGFGLSAVGSDDDILYSHVVTTNTSRGYISQAYNTATKETSATPFALIPEKCVPADAVGVFICAAPLTLQTTPLLPDSWYQGIEVVSDSIWEIDTEFGSTQLVVDFAQESGRSGDIMNIARNTTGDRLYFQDRYNQLLWVYELREQE